MCSIGGGGGRRWRRPSGRASRGINGSPPCGNGWNAISRTCDAMAAVPPERPDFFVVARFLERLWREGEPMLKTRLQVAANVNYDVFSRYLEWLRVRALVTVENNPDRPERPP